MHFCGPLLYKFYFMFEAWVVIYEFICVLEYVWAIQYLG